MNTDNILINTQSSIKINADKVIYFDPYQISDDFHDADIIFITHSHYDHMDTKSIEKIKNDETIIVAPKSVECEIKKLEFNNYIFLNPFEEVNISNVIIKTVPAYNINKPFHPRENNWLGYIVSIEGITYFVAGDTDLTEEIKNIECDIAFIPIGGNFTMDVDDAANLVKQMGTKIVIPTHYGSIVGNKNDGEKLRSILSSENVEVIEKLEFN